jgi:lipopolysaccharide assembly outer membrane protein LptD (OstA)
VSAYAAVNLSDYWSINASSSYDLEENDLLSIGGGLHYLDECFELTFESTYTPAGDTEETEGDFSFFFSVNFKNLGGVDVPL